MLTADLSSDLKRLRLPAMADNLDLRSREAEEAKLGYLEFAALLVQDELASRESNSFQKRLKAAGVASKMTFETFDYDFNSVVLPPQVVRDLASCRFIEQRRNLVLAGPPGSGSRTSRRPSATRLPAAGSTSPSSRPTSCSSDSARIGSQPDGRSCS